MANSRFDSRVFRIFRTLLWPIIAVPVLIAAQQDIVIHRPLPDIRQLLSDVEENQKQLESLLDQYSCSENEEVRELDKNGQVKKTIVKEYMDFYLGWQLVRREVKKDGRPLSADAQKKEDSRIEKRIRDYDKKKSEGDDAAQKKERIDVSTFLRSSNFTHPRWEQFRAHEVIVFDFVPNPAYKPKNKTEDLLHKLIGTVWIDDQARQVVRLEAHLSDAYKLAGGLLASIRKGSSLVMEQAKTGNNEVWLPSYVEAHFSARLLLVSSSLGDYTSKFSDYKKFRVETVKGKQVK